MSHSCLFGLHIEFVIFLCWNFNWNSFVDSKTKSVETIYFGRIIGRSDLRLPHADGRTRYMDWFYLWIGTCGYLFSYPIPSQVQEIAFLNSTFPLSL